MIEKHIFDARLRVCHLERTQNATDAVAMCDSLLVSKNLSKSQTARVKARRARIIETVHTVISEGFTVDGKHLLDLQRATTRSNLKNALRELNQKRIKNSQSVRMIKRRHYRDKNYECPRCKSVVTQLTSAHISSSVSRMIDRILDANPRADLPTLYRILVKAHDHVTIAICCRACNDELERTVCSDATTPTTASRAQGPASV